MDPRFLGATRPSRDPPPPLPSSVLSRAVRILHRRHLAEDRTQMEKELAAEHEVLSGGLQRAVEIDVVDEIIDPERTRAAIAAEIVAAPQRRGTHGNIPL